MAELALLVDRLRNLLSIVAVPATAFDPGQDDMFSEKYWLTERCLVDCFKDQGTFVTNHFENILPTEKQPTLRHLGEFILHLAEGLEHVQAKRDSSNDAAPSISPPVMPSELVLIAPREFADDILKPRRDQLSRFWTDAQVEAVEREHRELCSAKMLNTLVTAALDEETIETSFNDGWDAVKKAAAPTQFSHLRQFCCGLATGFTNTASVESDFSILKWEMNDRRAGLTSLGLEEIFQAKQFEQLDKL